MHEPLKVLGQLGGWRGMETIVECYQRPNQDQLREALMTRATVDGVPLTVEGGGSGESPC